MQEFIFTLVIIYVLFRVFGKNVKVYHYHSYKQQEPERKPEGKISIDRNPAGKKGKSDDNGEYIDYEEIK